jgi:hypothetical protein
MAIEHERLEAGIYLLKLAGVVRFEDFYHAQSELFPQITAAGDEQFIILVEMDTKTHIPIDFSKARLVFQRDQSKGVVIIGQSSTLNFIGRNFQQLFPKTRIQYVKTRAEALTIARTWL